MSHPARLLLRAPPHLPFIQGYPGIPSSPNRKAAGVHGSLELRIGSIPVKAKWVRVEIRKYESLPPGFPNSPASSSNYEPTWEHIGDIQTLWKPSDSSKEVDNIETSDFKFYLPLPENIPSSVELPRGTGIRYELVAAICYKQKGGLFKKESYPILKISEPLNIIKHELNSSWPIYNLPQEKIMKFSNDQLILNVTRPNTAFSSGDRIQFVASLKSTKSQPFKLKGFECTIHEVITSIPIQNDNGTIKGGSNKKKKSLQNPITKSRPVSIVKAAVDERIALGGEKSARIEMSVERVLVTVKNARTLKVEYELEVKAVLDGSRDKVEMSGIMYTVGVFGKNTAEQAMREIGRVDELCPHIPQPSPPPPPVDPTPFAGSQPDLPPNARQGNNSPYSPNAFDPNRTSSTVHQPQFQQQLSPRNFDPRQDFQRHSSGMSDSTFTTTNTNTREFGMAPNQNRPYTTMPLDPGQRRQDVMFPNPQPLRNERPRSVTPTSPTVESTGEGHDRYVQSDVGHDNVSRYSTATMATFGRWDKGLKNAMVSNLQDNASMPSSDNAVTPTTPTATLPSTRQSSPMTQGPSRPVSAKPPVPPSSFYMTAEQEKLAQRERYEAAKNLAATSQIPQAGQSSKKNEDEIPDLPPPEYAPPVPAQPKKQYTAPSRPVSEYTTPSNPSSPRNTNSPRLASPPPTGNIHRTVSPPPATQAGASSDVSPPNRDYLSAEEEKEIQRRRYEGATSRMTKRLSVESNHQVEGSASASAPRSEKRKSTSPRRESSIIQQLKSSPPLLPRTSSEERPIPYNAIFPPGRKSFRTENTPIGLGISSNLETGSGSGSGLSEKEQMRRYYEAQEAVAQAQASSHPNSPNRLVGVGNSSVLSRKTGGGSIGSINTPSSSSGHPNADPSGGNGNATNALDEKEQMRRYYEAQDRVASASGGAIAEGSGSAHISPAKPAQVVNLQNASRPSSATGHRVVSSPIDEKEQMRRYYEAQDRVAAANRGEGSSGNVIQSATNSPTQARQAINTSGAVDEKEQMRRYYEAQDKVAAANRGESSGPPQQSAQNSPHARAAVPSAINEKEQMRRYYEAQDRVARASQSPNPGPSNSRALESPTPSPVKLRAVSGPQGALDEKEQMRRYYEAQDKVAQANQNPAQSSSSTSTSREQVKSQSTPDHPPKAPSGSGGTNALSEKEQMRRYYEAMDRVNQASGSGPGSGSQPNRNDREPSSSPPPPILAPPVDSPPAFDDLHPPPTTSDGNGISNQSKSGSGYISAEAEKELMRKRYEQATSAVERHSSSSPPPPPIATPPPGPVKNQPRSSLGLVSQQLLNDDSPNTNPFRRDGNLKDDHQVISPPDSPLITRDPTIKAGKAKARTSENSLEGGSSAGAGVPPPPLPARPPREYVELLSPV